MKNIITEGHRGYCAKYPENTLISFEGAMDLGVDAVEFDVWLTADKVPVLIHDGNCRRTCGVDVHVRDLSLDQVKQLSPHYPDKFGDKYAESGLTIPTLEELLKLRAKKRPDLMLGVEIKEYTEETVDITVALLKEYGVFDKCWFYAFNGRIIKYIKTCHNGRTMGYPDFLMKEYAPDTYSHYVELGLALNYVRSEIFPIYKDKGLPIHAYCADTEADVRMCIDKSASLITANDPVPLLKVLGRLGPIIQSGHISDLDFVAGVEAASFPPAEAASRASFDRRLRLYPAGFWILYDGGTPCAFVNSMESDKADLSDDMFESNGAYKKDGAWEVILSVATLPEHRGKGYARTLLRKAIEDTRARGKKGLVLTCKEHLLPFYASVGFVSEGVSASTHGGAVWYQMRLTFAAEEAAK